MIGRSLALLALAAVAFACSATAPGGGTSVKTRTDATVHMGIRKGDNDGPLTESAEAPMSTVTFGSDLRYDFAARTHVVMTWTYRPDGGSPRKLHGGEYWFEGKDEKRVWIDDTLEKPGSLECRWAFDDGSALTGVLRIVP